MKTGCTPGVGIVAMAMGLLFLPWLSQAQDAEKPKLETVTIQLKWFHQYQFAGYYAAIEKGFYAEEGLNVILRERDPATGHIDDVLEGRAEYGVADAGLIFARMQGHPVVLLSQVFQHSPLVFLTLTKSAIRTAYDLDGKRVMLDSVGNSDAPLKALLLKTLGGLDKVDIMPQTFRNEDLIEGQTDAVLVYVTDQPFWFREQGVPVNVIDPRDYGIDFYGDNLFTTEAEAENNPQRVEKLIRATLKGWRYAVDNQEEIVDLILEKYSPEGVSRARLLYEAAQTASMIASRFIELGHYETTKYQKIVGIYAELGLTDQYEVDEGFFYKPTGAKIGLTTKERQWLAQRPVIRVHNEKNWRPFNYYADDRPQGYSISYLDLLAEKVGFQIEYVTGRNWDEYLQMIREKELDVMLNTAWTQERALYMLFTGPYLTIAPVLYSRVGVERISSVAGLSGKRIAIPKGFFLEEILKGYPEIEIVSVADTQECVLTVSSGKADFLFDLAPTVEYFAGVMLIDNLQPGGRLAIEAENPTDLRIGVRDDWPILRDLLQKGMAAVTEYERAALERQWLKERAAPGPELALPPDEREFLRAHPVIRVHNEKDWPPFNYHENGKPQGLSIDYMDLLANILGISVEYVTGPTWGEFLQMIERKDLDVMLNIVRTEDRRKYVLFTETYARNPNVIVSTVKDSFNTIEELFGKTVAFPKGFFYEEVLTKGFPQIERLPLKDTLACLKAVSFGDAQATFGEEAVVRSIIARNMLTDLQVSGEVEIGDPDLPNLRIGVRNDWPLLHSALAAAMSAVTPKQMQDLQQKWLSKTSTSATVANGKNAREARWIVGGSLVIAIVGIFCLLSLGFWIIIRTTKKKDIALSFGSKQFRILTLAGLSAIFAVVVMVGLLLLQRNRREMVTAAEVNLEATLENAEARLNQWVKQRISDLEALGHDRELTILVTRLLQVKPDRESLLTAPVLADIRRFFEEQQNDFPNIGFFIINPDHISIGSRRDANVGTPNLIAEQYQNLVEQAFQGEALFVPPVESDVSLSDVTGTAGGKNPPTMFFLGPVRQADGTVLAAMTLRVDPLGEFSEALRYSTIRAASDTYAISRDGGCCCRRFVLPTNCVKSA